VNEGEREVLRVLNNPKLMRGEKAGLVKKLTGTAPHPAGPGMADIKRTARGYEGQQPESVLRHRQAVG
jgi:hypothetical protein